MTPVLLLRYLVPMYGWLQRTPPASRLTVLLVSLLAAFATGPAFGATIRLHAASTANGPAPDRDSIDYRRFDWTRLRAGDVVELLAGTYHGTLTISARGRADAPVMIRAAKGAVPIVVGGIAVSGGQWVTISGLTLTNPKGIAIGIREGASHVTVENNDIHSSGLGIWIGAAAKGSHRISGNRIRNSRTHGIAIDGINLGAEEMTAIVGNWIAGNGHHGIEIHGSRYRVEGNRVTANGASLPGTSGIHCFSRSEKEGTGRFNVIRNNIVWNQRDANGPDGNGIQLDRWCDGNEVTGNTIFANDGAGISVFHAANNRIEGNRVHGNMLDAGRSHIPRIRGDVVITNDVDLPPRTIGNQVLSNRITATRESNAALLLDADTARATAIVKNSLSHAAGGALISTGPNQSLSISQAQSRFAEIKDNLEAALPEDSPQAPQAPTGPVGHAPSPQRNSGRF